MASWGMVIDLKRCVGCSSCVVACKSEHGLPKGIFFTRVLEQTTGKYPLIKKKFVPVLCNHCREAPCEKSCPTGATYRSKDDIILVNSNDCVGCRSCYVACPYKNRHYLRRGILKESYFGSSFTPYEEFHFKKYQERVVLKCNFCQHRLEQGLEPACVQTCPAEARIFGDLDDPKSVVSQKIARNPVRQLLAEIDTKPRVYYLER